MSFNEKKASYKSLSALVFHLKNNYRNIHMYIWENWKVVCQVLD